MTVLPYEGKVVCVTGASSGGRQWSVTPLGLALPLRARGVRMLLGRW
jgi:hypothetical protein